jgi:hypothetical protein
MIAEILLVWASIWLVATRVYSIISRVPNLTFKKHFFDPSKIAQGLTFTRHLDLQILSISAFVARTRHGH